MARSDVDQADTLHDRLAARRTEIDAHMDQTLRQAGEPYQHPKFVFNAMILCQITLRCRQTMGLFGKCGLKC